MTKHPLLPLFLLPFFLAHPVSADALRTGFANPPDSAKPQTWWHWADGNIVKEAITAELEAMSQIGLGGFHLFMAGHYPRIPNPKVPCFTPEWYAMIEHAAKEADRLGLAMTAQDCAGWSTAGGPWITPDKNMFLVDTEVFTSADGRAFELKAAPSWPETGKTYYRELGVFAFPTPKALQDVRPLPIPVVRSSYTNDLFALATTNKEIRVLDGKGWIEFEFPQEVTVRSVEITGGRECIEPGERTAEVLCEKNGILVPVAKLNTFVAVYNCAEKPFSHALPTFTARRIRLNYADGSKLQLRRVVFSRKPVLSALPAKVGAEGLTLAPDETLPEDSAAVLPLKGVTNLTHLLTAERTLIWQPPAGHWTCVRVGYRGTNKHNAPAPAEATGLECDKFTPETVAFHFDNYIGKMLERTRAAGAKSFTGILVDSWEAHTQNWSPNFAQEFKTRRGYDPVPQLCVFAGFILENRDYSERYLRDIRQTCSDLVSENFFGILRKKAHANGMKVYAESCGGSGAGVFVADALQHYFHVDYPMTEAGRPMREAVSASRTTGNPIVAMESYTQGGGANWADSPRSLKSTGDGWFCDGITRIVFHTYAHNPDLNALHPGPAFWKYGLPFSRGQTWWKSGTAWITYLSRCQFLLQQGLPGADVLYWYGEEPAGPIPDVFERRHGTPDAMRGLPDGYDWDLLAPDILPKLTVKNKKIITPGGGSYSLLVLRPSIRMTPEAAKQIARLVAQGAVVCASVRPEKSPSLSNHPQADREVLNTLGSVWSSIKTNTLTQVLKEIGLPPDVSYTANDANSNIRTIHRRLPDGDLYYLSNQPPARDVEAALTFRSSYSQAELWNPIDGTTTALPCSSANGLATVKLGFAAGQSFFVHLTGKSNAPKRKDYVDAQVLDAEWKLAFEPGWGAPDSIQMTTLTDLTTHSDPAIRYYSGTIRYTTTFEWKASQTEARLKFEKIGVIADVTVNGKKAGILWTEPYVLPVTLKQGRNELQIDVANTWANRLIGESFVTNTVKKTWTSYHNFKPDTPIGRFTTGLIGPVTLQTLQD